MRGEVVGEVEDPARFRCEVGFGGMGDVAVEEQHVAGFRGHVGQREAGHLLRGEGAPFVADQPREARGVGHPEASVLLRRAVDADEGGEEEWRIGGPAGLLVLMRFEAGAAEELGGGVGQAAAAHEAVEAFVKGAEILDPLDHALAFVEQAVLAIDPVAARGFRGGGQLLGSAGDPHGFLGRVEAARGEPAGSHVMREALGREGAFRDGKGGLDRLTHAGCAL